MDFILTAIVPCLSIPSHPGITLRQVDCFSTNCLSCSNLSSYRIAVPLGLGYHQVGYSGVVPISQEVKNIRPTIGY